MANGNNNKLTSNRVVKKNVDLYKVEPFLKIVCYKPFSDAVIVLIMLMFSVLIFHTKIKSFEGFRIIIREGYFMENAIKILSLINNMLCLLSHVASIPFMVK